MHPNTHKARSTSSSRTLETPTGDAATNVQLCVHFQHHGIIEQHVFQLDNLWIVCTYFVHINIQFTQPNVGSGSHKLTASYDLQGVIIPTAALSNLWVTLQLILLELIDDIPQSSIPDWSHLYQPNLQWNWNQSYCSTPDMHVILLKSISPSMQLRTVESHTTRETSTSCPSSFSSQSSPNNNLTYLYSLAATSVDYPRENVVKHQLLNQ
jgi:hypothetical protein